jgi:hypothetical protein
MNTLLSKDKLLQNKKTGTEKYYYTKYKQILFISIFFLFQTCSNTSFEDQNQNAIYNGELWINADCEQVLPGTRIGVKCTMYDVDTSGIKINWKADCGTIIGTPLKDSIIFCAPEDTGNCNLTVTVSNGIVSSSATEQITVYDNKPPLVWQQRIDSIHVQLGWSTEYSPYTLRIERTTEQENRYSLLALVPGSLTTYYDTTITAGSVWKYRITIPYSEKHTPYAYLIVDRIFPELTLSYPSNGQKMVPGDTIFHFSFSKPLSKRDSKFSLNGDSVLVQYNDSGNSVEVKPVRGFFELLRNNTCTITAVDSAGNFSRYEIRFQCYSTFTSYNKQIYDIIYNSNLRNVIVLTKSSIDEFELSSGKLVSSIPVSTFEPTRFAQNPIDKKYYITSSNECAVYVINPLTGQIDFKLPVLSDGHPEHKAKNPRSIVFASNGVGLVEVHANGLSGAGHSLEQIRVNQNIPEISYRSEFKPGNTDELEIIASQKQQCILLFNYNSSVMDTYRYNQNLDLIQELKENDGFFFFGTGAPLTPEFLIMQGREKVIFNSNGIKSGHTGIQNDQSDGRQHYLVAFSYDTTSFKNKYVVYASPETVIEVSDFKGNCIEFTTKRGLKHYAAACIYDKVLLFTSEGLYGIDISTISPNSPGDGGLTSTINP